jgi:flagellar hook-length control protein FliK
MTSTAVKETGSMLMNLAVAQAGRNTENSGGFQKIWDNQMNRENAGTADRDSDLTASGKRQLQRGSSLRAKENRPVQEEENISPEELSPEKQEQAMEVLNGAALELMQEIADVFGISMEELQAVLGEMNLEPTDLLNASELGALLLNLGGAEDVCALITDGELYENYQMLMEKLNAVLQESAETLETEPEVLTGLLEEGLVDEALPAETEEAPVRAEDMTQKPESAESAEAENTPAVNVTEEAPKKEQEAGNQNSGQSRGEEGHSESRTGKGEYVNPFIQDLRTDQFRPEFLQSQDVTESSPWSESTRAIMDQILDYMKVQLTGEVTSLEMQLHPASLGTLQVQIASKAGVMTANFITQNETVKAALESQMVQLKEQFEEQGVKVEAIEVTVQTHEFERNLDEQGRGRNQQEPERKGRTRRIHLGEGTGADTLEGEDALAADMLAAGGSTVDYTV